MAKAGYLNKNVLESIGGVYLKHKDWKAKEVLTEVNKTLASHGLNEIALSTVQRELARYHKKEREQALSGPVQAIDRIWSIGVLKEKAYELPVESIPLVLEIANQRIHARQSPLTTREALWASRLYPVIARFNQRRELPEIARIVDEWVEAYATADLISELVGEEHLNTPITDWQLCESHGDHKESLDEQMRPPPDFENPLKEMTPEERDIITRSIAVGSESLVSNVPQD